MKFDNSHHVSGSVSDGCRVDLMTEQTAANFAGSSLHLVRVRRLFVLMAALALLSASVCASGSAAQWSLDPAHSYLSFGSIKQGDTGEAHAFKKLQGQLADSGKASISIDLASVDTGIDVRNQRMGKMLFHTAEHPDAKITANVDMGIVNGLAPGQSVTHETTVTLSIAGHSHELKTKLMVTRLSDSRFMVQPIRLIMLDASDFGLVDGIHKLRKIAELDAISTAVPVDFVFTFNRQ